ncbi:MAG: ferritin-like domain-containing protein [Litorimonas sp.]
MDTTQTTTPAELDHTPLMGPDHITSREQLIGMLGEASEVEHNLMCTYLYAAFSLKTEESDGLTDLQLEAVRRWRASIVRVAIEEMGHLAIVANLSVAIGGPARFDRLNFPIAPGPLPANMSVRLAPFTRDTLQHFIFLERPNDSDEPDGESFVSTHDYVRGPLEQSRLMPNTHDYDTVGTLYESIYKCMETLCDRYGANHLFVGDESRQVGSDITPLPGLMTVGNITEARRAIDVIVEQGEGAAACDGQGHFARFRAIREEWKTLLDDDPTFVPGRPVAHNPVMRRPPTPDGKVWITHADSARVLDYANALYIQQLRLLSQAFGRPGDVYEKQVLINAATDLMYAMTPAAEALTTYPAQTGMADTMACNAGMTFATVRGMSPLPIGTEWQVLNCRFNELVDGGKYLRGLHDKIDRSLDMLGGVAATFSRHVDIICLDPNKECDA